MLSGLAFLIVIMLLLGAPIFAIMLGFGAVGAASTSREGMQDFAGQMLEIFKLGSGEPAQILSTIPLFIFMGFLMAEAKTGERLVKASNAWIGWMPGGLAVVTIFTCSIFTIFSGGSGVTIVALGGLLMPTLIKANYPKKFSLGVVAGTGSVGLLLPFAVPLFVYGVVYGVNAQLMSDTGQGEMKLIEWSTTSFLVAGAIPGLVLIGILSGYGIWVAKRNNVPRQKFDRRALFKPTLALLPEMMIGVIIVVGLLVLGLQISEVAALCVFYTLVLEVFVFKDYPLKKLWPIIGESMALVGAIFIIIFAATALSNYFVTAEIPKTVFTWIKETFDNKWTFLLALNLILLVVGMTMDIFSAIVIVVPLIVPVTLAGNAAELGFTIDPYHLGIIFLLNLEIGYLTPPVGLNLFIAAYHFKRPILDVIKATFPFLLCMVAALAIVTYIPALTVVPAPERRGSVGYLFDMVEKAEQRANAVEKLTLPDGMTIELSSCDAKEGLEKSECTGLFLSVTRCRKQASGAADSECEKEVIGEYVKNNAADDDDWNDDEDDDDEDEDDEVDEDDEDTEEP